jgi:hypothetical protein
MTETDDKILMQLGTARHALAAARSIGDFKKIADVAALAERYAKRVKLSQETADFALEIRLRAERGLGEVLARTPKHKGSLKRGPTLPEGNHRESSTWLSLASSDVRIPSHSREEWSNLRSGHGAQHRHRKSPLRQQPSRQ